ncbi:D-alanyl-D-alanine carboxypeptidase family protein [Hephaestia sp. GCM10023244]|uniref:D-alanyl-D-alanine carboxypeptidase family protein n=1 Tax=unclassified Hephaestia TaxID=2631281 RepID=UPI0020773442|nr:D-alanyl-D-alanine carboxypeptidase family protein [Hephaestia sp. MAHUQ-44]MCM8731417.1 D-alanyl-D-alanine carboxypeptidase [Hephaestia sp. MAHUQ-44]
MKKLFVASIAAIALSYPTMAAAPPFDTPAPVAYLKDLSSGAVLYAKNPDARIPPASLAKMMTVYLAFDMIKQGRVKLDQMITVRPETWERWHGPKAGSTMFLSPNEQVSVANLLYGIITLSGNDACVVLAEGLQGTEEAWVSQMNAEAKKLGMTNSQFGTSNGWPDNGVSYVTARDLTKLAEATIEEFPELYKNFYSKPDFTWGKTLGGEAITQANRDPLLGRVAGADGLKTGHTQESGYSFTGSAEQNGRRLVMVVSGLTSFNQRISESVRFMNWGFRAWQAHPIVAKGKQVSTAEVQMGSAGSVGLVAPRELTVTVPSGALPEMSAKVVYSGPIKAPIKAGQHIADLVIQLPDTGPQTVPLVAANDVGEAGFFRRAWNGLTSLFG